MEKKTSEKMTSGQFIKMGQKITGVGHGYQMPLAEKLGISLRQVQRYAGGLIPITITIELAMKQLNEEGE